jgi:alanine racemase
MKINLTALKFNLDQFYQRLKPDTKLMIMIKASAYGTGPIPIAQWVEKTCLADYLAVAYVSEGVDLRCSGKISLPIMIMIVTDSEFETCYQFTLEPVIYSMHLLDKLIEFLDKIEGNVKPFPHVHLKLDTGLHRLGISFDQLPYMISKLIVNSHRIHIKSIYSHFIGSYNSELDSHTQRQADLFLSSAEYIEKGLGYSTIKHLCNSGGIIRHPNLHLDMVRLGLGMYGVWPTEPKMKFQKTVISLFAPIVQLNYVNEDQTVGYTQYLLKRPSLIGVLRIGYADGLARHLNSGEGRVWICEQRVPILSLSMDMTMIDLTDVTGQVQVNDQVEIFGEHLPVEEMAEWCKMVCYEFLLGFGQRIKRIYIEENSNRLF